MAQIWNIPAQLSFADHFADWLLGRVDNPLNMADVTVWVPSPRQARALQQALMKKTDDKLVLPKLKPFHVDDDDMEALRLLTMQSGQSRVVQPQERLMFLARQVQMKDKSMNPAQVMHAAQSLASLFDRLTAHNIPLDAVENIVPDHLSAHWRDNISFMQISTQFYPLWLGEKQALDAAQVGKEGLLLQADRYKNAPTEDLVVAAGFADTTPTGVMLLNAIINLPSGHLILPGFHKCKTTPTHPQFGMHQLLADLGTTTDNVKNIVDVQEPNGIWMSAFNGVPTDEALNNTTLIEAESVEMEANTIALVMRDALETPDLTCALVTPDRNLAKRVVAALKRWDVLVDDSAGDPLSQTALGRIFVSLLDVAIQRARPVFLAGFLRQPHVNFGLENKVYKDHLRQLDKHVLRGAMPKPGFSYLQARAEKIEADEPRAKALALVGKIQDVLKPLMAVQERTFSEWVALHRTLFEHIVDLAAFRGQQSFDQLKKLLENVQEGSEIAGKISLEDYAAYLVSFMQSVTVRPRQSAHPRLFIWGPLEARLQQVDRVVIGGCNEGTWPGTANADMWLNRRMQQDLGLPQPETIVGLNAHDFYQLVHHGDVYITRTLRDENGETLPSRYLSRLQMVLHEKHWKNLKKRGEKWLAYNEVLQREGEASPSTPATAVAPLAARPKYWSASYVKTLMQCPYKAYSAKILKLQQKNNYEEPADAADRGELIHTCLEAFFQQVPHLPAPWEREISAETRSEMIAHLQLIGETAFSKLADDAARVAWWPRFTKLVDAFIDELILLTQQGSKPEKFEYQAKHALGHITLHATADRVDMTPEGQMVIDYKTGSSLPSVADTKNGREPQMAVEAFLASKNGFGLGQNVAGTQFWHLKSGGDKAVDVKIVPSRMDVDEWLEETAGGLERLEHAYATDEQAYEAVPGNACTMCDYAGICRFKEWVGT